MSGPKISVYSLTGWMRTNVMEQIRCEQQSLVCAAQIQEMIQSFSVNFDQVFQNVQLLMKRTAEGSGEQLEMLQALREEVESETEKIRKELLNHPPRLSPKYWITEEARLEKQAELKHFQDLRKRAEKLKAKIDAVKAANGKRIDQIQAGIIQDLFAPDADGGDESEPRFWQRDQERNISKIQSSIVEDLSGGYSFEFDAETAEGPFLEKKDAIQKDLYEFLKDIRLPENLVKEIKQAILSLQKIKEMQVLKNFDAITVKGIATKVRTYKREEERRKAELAELIARYEALCEMAGVDAKRFPDSGWTGERIKSEVERLESLIVQQQEQAYISDCIDEVMSELGYDLIGSREVTKKNGKRFKNELFTFGEGTAVNVTFSQNGQVAMELGGLAKEDRVPTSEETAELTQEMEKFCGVFEQFEHEMLLRGIMVGNRVTLSPPTAEYAAIINLNDYEVEEDRRISLMNVAEKRLKKAEKKRMKAGE